MINLDDNINGKFIEILGRKGLPLALISLIFISGVFSKTGVEGDNEVDKILEKANESLNEGLFEDARDYFNEVLNLDNNNIEANAGVIKSYIAEKNLDEALTKLKSVPKEIENDNVFQKLNSEIELNRKTSKFITDLLPI